MRKLINHYVGFIARFREEIYNTFKTAETGAVRKSCSLSCASDKQIPQLYFTALVWCGFMGAKAIELQMNHLSTTKDF